MRQDLGMLYFPYPLAIYVYNKSSPFEGAFLPLSFFFIFSYLLITSILFVCTPASRFTCVTLVRKRARYRVIVYNPIEGIAQ